MLADPNFGAFLSMISSVNVTTDAINLSAPLSLFANDDGNVNISAYASTVPSVTIGFGDLFGTGITWGGFTVLAVPESSSAPLLLLGLTFLIASRNRSRRL
ncbi:MAG: PEP-CTERM sorting domain-containing protein [Hydrogenophilales bacterium]|nr:PEP-CTERM sorting domain-containing protein [Hydrogenophilales bacterium]